MLIDHLGDAQTYLVEDAKPARDQFKKLSENIVVCGKNISKYMPEQSVAGLIPKNNRLDIYTVVRHTGYLVKSPSCTVISPVEVLS